MNKLLKNRTDLFGKVGSFWYRQTSKENPMGISLVRALARMEDYPNVGIGQINAVDRIMGNNKSLHSNFEISFDRKDITVLTLDLQERVVSEAKDVLTGEIHIAISLKEDYNTTKNTIVGLEDDSGHLATELGDFLLFPTDMAEFDITLSPDEAKPRYLVRIPTGIEPICIRGKDKELISGITFRAANGFLVFDEDPLEIFESNIMHVRSGWREHRCIHSYTMKLDGVYTSGFYVAEYLRKNHSAKAMERALAEIAGIPILPSDSFLNKTYSSPNGDRIYEFEDYVVRVPHYIYHTELQPGNFYEAGTIIGDYVHIYTAPSVSDTWHQNLDWEDGLSLDGLCPFSGLVVPNRMIVFDAVNSTGGNYHYRPHIEGDEDTLQSYWNFIENGEKSTGNYLQDAFSAPYPNDKYANALDFYFEHLLGDRAMVFDLQTENLGSHTHNNVLAFIKRELPVGVIPIIRDSRQFSNVI